MVRDSTGIIAAVITCQAAACTRQNLKEKSGEEDIPNKMSDKGGRVWVALGAWGYVPHLGHVGEHNLNLRR